MENESEKDMMVAGSWEAISYQFFLLLDEIGHGLKLDNFEWVFHFCQWCHRKD